MGSQSLRRGQTEVEQAEGVLRKELQPEVLGVVLGLVLGVVLEELEEVGFLACRRETRGRLLILLRGKLQSDPFFQQLALLLQDFARNG